MIMRKLADAAAGRPALRVEAQKLLDLSQAHAQGLRSANEA
jgi:hypothetical protein